MENFGFEVELNGEKLCRAGFDCKHFVTTCIIGSVRTNYTGKDEESLYISVGGLANNQHVDWEQTNLKLGDKLVIEVINDNFDQPTIRREYTEEEHRRIEIEAYYRLKEKLKEYLDEE